MKTKSLILILAVTMLSMVLLAGGCKKEEPNTLGDAVKTVEGEVKEALCSKCGQIEGTDLCCQPDAVKCDKCGKDKGSPGCCI